MVVEFGLTTALPLSATGFPFNKTCVAFDVVHWSVLLWPLKMVVGDPVNEVTVGQPLTVTVVDWVAVWIEQSLLVTVIV